MHATGAAICQVALNGVTFALTSVVALPAALMPARWGLAAAGPCGGTNAGLTVAR